MSMSSPGPTLEAPPFAPLVQTLPTRSALRLAITAACRRSEPDTVDALLGLARLPPAMAEAAQQLALQLAGRLRQEQVERGRSGLVQGLLQEFALSSQEGVALMCLAEALLRIPDNATRDALIRDKVREGDWQAHLGHSQSLFVNAAAWGLLLTGRLLAAEHASTLPTALGQALSKGSEPLIRRAVDAAMRLMGEQFISGQTIEEALLRARPLEAQGFRHSYDMLGEAALTADDAHRYFQAYEQAIHAIGQAAGGRGVYAGAGISIKLSALHPRYSRAQCGRVMSELYPALHSLATLARRYDIGLNIDAEEADRLELSLDLLERLCFEPELAGWHGIGFVVQAYQKRCLPVIDYLLDLAQRSGHRLMVRLVKGAYWDTEIKRAQLDGLDDYPVFTRKPHTDIAYLACARRLLGALDRVYPQFATHNARTLATIHQLAGKDFHDGQYEFQCLHGMGEPLYRQVVSHDGLARPCRIYAPVGSHETLLAYLVRRLLENGANTSFVNRVADPAVPLEDLVSDPVLAVERMAAAEGRVGLPHPRIPLPSQLFGDDRKNSRGLDLSSEHALRRLAAALLDASATTSLAGPMVAGDRAPGEALAVLNPADRRDQVGTVEWATREDVEQAYRWALHSAPAWQGQPPAERAARLERAADLLEAQRASAIALLVREAGKSYADAIGEVREAADFLRYYAMLARTQFDNATHRPLGPVVCISPWNFPLAIFTGQVAAALAAGNVVLAKPAEQTPLVAAFAVRLLQQAGISAGALQLLPGPGETIGAQLVADPRVRGVMFTGSTEVARLLQKSLAGRLDERGHPLVLIAETGGLNPMIVDSSALPEQAVQDALASAFNSAGQRCSALRILCLQEDIADRVLAMLKGAMAQLRVGDPQRLETDIGPLIDAAALQSVEGHIQAMADAGHRVFQAGHCDREEIEHGTFLLPTLIELDRFDQLEREVFGPVLHVVRYRAEQLDALLEQIHASGYGLTLGAHSRIDETIARIEARARVGNLYVNRNMIGAVVGVQPFGGEGLSGTGPKAGGPLYLYRLLSEKPADALHRALQGEPPRQPSVDLQALEQWATGEAPWLADLCRELARQAPAETAQSLTGPTGERNSYRLAPRDCVLCLADAEADLLAQLAAALAVGARPLWVSTALTAALYERLPAGLQARIERTENWRHRAGGYAVALFHGTEADARRLARQLADLEGPLVTLYRFAPGQRRVPLELLLVERAVSVNTAAAGGNASLMSLG